ncbi:MAG TPA: mechanosensitive ion channel domain-containing protein [Chitinophagaceae bacterium]|nr:mechanosensitive ion channel domain-containing protein [Chitinophagaceae bacterium]
MNRFLQQLILGNTVQDYLVTFGIIAFVLLLKKTLSRFLAKAFSKLFRRQWKDLNQLKFVALVLQPLSLFLATSISIIALYRLTFPDVVNITIYKYTLKTILHTIGIMVQIVLFIWLLLRVVDFIAVLLEKRANLTADQSDNQLILFFKDFFKVIIGIVGMLMLLHFAFNYNVGNLLTGLSIVGAAIALALRESLENLIASFIIFFDKPFTTGDTVKVQNITGAVERIGLRSTRLRTGDKSYVTVPNKQMVDSILDNISRRSQIRGEVLLHLNLQTPPDKVEVLIGELKNYLSGIEEVQTSNVVFNEIRMQAFVIMVEFFTMPIENNRFTAVKQALNLFALQAMEKNDVRLAAQGQELAFVA